MDIRLFGELEVVGDDGSGLPVKGAKQRSLIALLALHRGEPVGAERLIDALWGDDPPGNPANALQALVANVRRALGGAAVTTTDTGYALSIRPDDVDVVRFERLVNEGRRQLDAGNRPAAGHALQTALELRRGEPLAEFAFAEYAQGERTRLEELGLTALEARVEVDLADGRHGELIGELEALCREHPLRERLWTLQMLALYRAGRQADALRAYGEARKQLVEELGIEPGPELREMEAMVLAQDRSLAAPITTAPAPAEATRGNLSERLTTFIGRDVEVARVTDELSSHRLVTLIGPGGAGKTRLALEVASALTGAFAGGAWLVELAGVRDASDVGPAIATALRPADTASDADDSSRPAIERLLRQLRGQSLVVILDNCEHVIAEAATIAETLTGHVPELRIIATSREALAVPGEVLVPVGGLALDAAAELFADRARAARPGFAVDAEARPLIDDICRRLDGLPLALELAAARVRSLPLSQLAERLDDRFRVLTGGSRTALPRQQTLRAVVDWSYDLLFEHERRLFDRLAAFAGGCDLEAVEAVCADEQLDSSDIVDLLSRLVDKSLVTVEFDDLGARYSQLQTLWQYARERFAESPDAHNVRQRHADWYRSVAVAAGVGLRSRDATAWGRRLTADLDNLRVALDWFVESGDAAGAQELAGGIGWLWFNLGDAYEGIRWLEHALSIDDSPPSVRAMATVWHALYAATMYGPRVALAEALGAVETLRTHGDATQLTAALMILSELHNRMSELDASVEVLAEARVILDATSDEFGLGVHDIQLAGSLALDDLEGAEAAARSGVDHLRAMGDHWLVLEGLGLLAGLKEARGDLDGAVAGFEELLDAGRGHGISGYEAWSLLRIGAIRARQGDDGEALRFFTDSAQIRRRPAFTGAALIACAGASRRLGDLDAAQVALDEAAELYDAIDHDAGRSAVLVGRAWLALAYGNIDDAVSLADESCKRAEMSADAAMAHSAEITAAAVELRRSNAKAHRTRFEELVHRRSETDAGRFVAILGGAVAASLDEPDVDRVLASLE